MTQLPFIAEQSSLRAGHWLPAKAATQQWSDRIVVVEDDSAASWNAVRSMPSDASAPTVLFRLAASGAVPKAAAAIPAVHIAFPIAIAPTPSVAQQELQRLQQCSSQLMPTRMILQLTEDPSAHASLSSDRVRSLEPFASAWTINQAPASPPSSLLSSLLQHSSLPVLLTLQLPASTLDSCVGDTSLALRALDSLVCLPSLSRLHVSFVRTGHSADALDLGMLSAHWAALRGREQFRELKRKRDEEDAALQQRANLPRKEAKAAPHSASAVAASSLPTAAATAAASSSSAVVAVSSSAPAAVVPASAQFYRAGYSPSTMFYRIAISFSPALPVTDLLAHAVLQDALRSLLGLVGSAKCNFQLLQWSSDTATGLASSSCEMAVGVRGAWMLQGGYQGKTCRIDVLQQSVFLMALATR